MSKLFQTGSIISKFFNLLEIEIVKRDNFFFEIAEELGKIFNKKHKAFCVSLEKALDKNSTISTSALADLDSKFKLLYKKALKDVKMFRSYMKEILSCFIVTVIESISPENENYAPDEKHLNKLALKLIFLREHC